MKNAILILGLLLMTQAAKAAVTFEGTYRFMKGPAHVGTMIVRKEMMAGGRIKSTIYTYLKDVETAIIYHETDLVFAPLSGSLSRRGEGQKIEVTSKIQGSTLKVTARGGGAPGGEQTMTIPSGALFEEFIPDYIKITKRDFVPGTTLLITKLLDDPGLSVVDVSIGQPVTVSGSKVFPLTITPKTKELPQIHYVTPEGEVIRMAQGPFTVDLVASLKDAAGTLPIDMKEVERVFGGVPKVVRKGAATPAPAAGTMKK